MIPRLSCGACVFIFVKLLCPACCLVRYETAGRSRESDDSVWWLEFWHVSRVPPHFRFCGEPQDQFDLVRGGDKVEHIGVHWIETVEHVHGIVVRGGGVIRPQVIGNGGEEGSENGNSQVLSAQWLL